MPNEEALLEEFTQWAFPLQGSTDAVDDNAFGTIVRGENKKRNKNYWFIPGTWGATKRNPRNQIEVEKGTTLVCVVATSHATELELGAGETANEPTLQALAKRMDDLWMNPYIRIVHPNKKVVEKDAKALKPVTTRMFQTDIAQQNGYAKVIGAHGNGIKIVTVGRIYEFVPDEGKTEIVLAGQARADPNIGKNGEPQYDIQVKYEITTRRPPN
jgi:hypothetical protein